MIIYASRTGNVRAVVGKMNLPSMEMKPDLVVNEPYILFSYTDGIGQIPKAVDVFLQKNHLYCKGSFVSGNTNFGINNFAGAGDQIAKKYGIPCLKKIEMRGFPKDIEDMVSIYEKQIYHHAERWGKYD